MFGLGPEEVGILALSLKVALVSVLFSLPLAIVVAYVLARFSFPGKTLFDAVVHLPLVLPPVVVGFALLILLGKRGPIGSLLDEWFGTSPWGVLGCTLLGVAGGFVQLVRILRRYDRLARDAERQTG